MTGVRFPLVTFREFREVRAIINLRMESFRNKEVSGGSRNLVSAFQKARISAGSDVPKTPWLWSGETS
ncbi:hypothetical protein VZT92_004579 [Zoarces viviparus]|uniref:Uncharacterized protein n=1 Tax=Zoarces viviparus TaxID=48416 RepID=A0AAW1FYX2_ZOAVI